MRRSLAPGAGALALVLALTVVAPAAHAAPPAPARPLSASAHARTSKVAPARALVQDSTPAAAAQDSGVFSGTRRTVVLVLVAAGLGFTLWSKDKDRIHSPAR